MVIILGIPAIVTPRGGALVLDRRWGTLLVEQQGLPDDGQSEPETGLFGA